MNKIIIWFKNLNKNKQILIILFAILVMLLIFNNIMKKNRDNNLSWNYKTETINDSVLSKAEIEYSRIKYWELKSIIDTYIDSYIDESPAVKLSDKNIKVSYKDYYLALDNKYKISKAKYEINSTEFFSKLLVSGEYEEIDETLPYNIEKVYKYGKNMYLCSIKIDMNDDVYTIRGRGYIGIKLNEKAKTFSLFYIGGQYE